MLSRIVDVKFLLAVIATLAMVVLTYTFFLFAVTGHDVGERLATSTYMFLIAGTTVLGAVHYNYVRGPWAAKASDGSVRMYLIDLQPPEMVLLLLGLGVLLVGIAVMAAARRARRQRIPHRSIALNQRHA